MSPSRWKGVPRRSRIVRSSRSAKHFVGALYTLFAHLIGPTEPLVAHWLRPLTFGVGHQCDRRRARDEALDEREPAVAGIQVLILRVDEELDPPV